MVTEERTGYLRAYFHLDLTITNECIQTLENCNTFGGGGGTEMQTTKSLESLCFVTDILHLSHYCVTNRSEKKNHSQKNSELPITNNYYFA